MRTTAERRAKHGCERRSHPWVRYIRDISRRNEKHGVNTSVTGDCARIHDSRDAVVFRG